MPRNSAPHMAARAEARIGYETPNSVAYVYADPGAWTVCVNRPREWCAVSDSSYPRTPEGLTLAIARAEYLALTRDPETGDPFNAKH